MSDKICQLEMYPTLGTIPSCIRQTLVCRVYQAEPSTLCIWGQWQTIVRYKQPPTRLLDGNTMLTIHCLPVYVSLYALGNFFKIILLFLLYTWINLISYIFNCSLLLFRWTSWPTSELHSHQNFGNRWAWTRTNLHLQPRIWICRWSSWGECCGTNYGDYNHHHHNYNNNSTDMVVIWRSRICQRYRVVRCNLAVRKRKMPVRRGWLGQYLLLVCSVENKHCDRHGIWSMDRSFRCCNRGHMDLDGRN